MTKTYRPSVSQRLIWFDQVRSPASSKYNIGGFAQLWGGLSYERFNQTLRRIIDAQEVYTTRIMEIDFEPVCVVEGLPFDYAIPIIDLSLAPDPERTALERMEEDFALPFEIEGNYLYKFLLFKISDTKHFWYAKIHHIISDGMSFKLLLNQAAEIYNLYGNDAGTEDIRYAYSEYALEDERYYQSQEMAADREYWINEFHASREALLHKRSRGGSGSAAGSDTLLIPKGSKDMLQALADHHKASVFNVILALVLIYFARTRGCNEIVVGVPVLNRTKKKYRSTAGVFMNLLALPFAVDTGGTLGDIIRMTKEGMSKALRHQRYQYGNLVNELQLAEGKPLYDIRISYEDFAFTSTFGDLKSAATALSNHAEIDKLAIYLRDYHNEGFDVRFVYDRDFLSDEEIRSIKCCLETSIRTALASGSVAVEEMELLDEEEKRRIIEFSTGPAKPRPRHSFPQLWEEVCLAYPDNICISCVSGTYSVTDIDHRSTLLSHSLRSLKENKRIDKVALLLPRSEKMIVAMLGCMKASLAYIPLDHEYPVFRVNLILKDAGCRILLTSNEFPRSAEGDGLYDAETMVIEEEDHPIRAQQAPEAGSGMDDDVCYIIYTSGSTGKPKGVGISSSSLADYVYTFREYFSLSAEDVVLQQSSFAFDTSVEEIR